MVEPAASPANASVARALKATFTVSLLCIVAFGVYLLSQQAGLGLVIALLGIPVGIHLVAFHLLRNEPGSNAIVTCVAIALVSGLLALAILGLTLLDWAMSGTPVLPLIVLVYLVCQGRILYLSHKWNR